METDMDMSDDDCTHRHHLRNAAHFANAAPFLQQQLQYLNPHRSSNSNYHTPTPPRMDIRMAMTTA